VQSDINEQGLSGGDVTPPARGGSGAPKRGASRRGGAALDGREIWAPTGIDARHRQPQPPDPLISLGLGWACRGSACARSMGCCIVRPQDKSAPFNLPMAPIISPYRFCGIYPTRERRGIEKEYVTDSRVI
jgi:hypothetical protein